MGVPSARVRDVVAPNEDFEVTASRILILHTPSQRAAASSLVDLLEASLALSDDAIACSSLPFVAGQSQGAAEFGSFGAAIALIDEGALGDHQLWFDLATAWAQRRRVAVLIDGPELRKRLPKQLKGAEVILLDDRAALIALVEDLAFDLDLSPRIGQDAQRALVRLSSMPPPMDEEDNAVELEDEDVQQVPVEAPPAIEPARDEPSCALAFVAGRSISDCSFHSDEGGDFVTEVEHTFGCFIDAVGGSWAELKRIADVEMWIAATDNLLDALDAPNMRYAQWYRLGFQFATLQSIAEHGPPAEPDERATFLELWNENIAQLRQAAMVARVAAHDVRRIQTWLENLIGPETQRDYTNVARAREELFGIAQQADLNVKT